LINLMKNAIWAVLTSNIKLIELKAFTDRESRLKITLRDTGIGINKDDLDKIFIPFYTTRSEGSGIGLSLSRQLLILNGGSISIQSNIEGETTFIMEFQI